MSLAVAVAALTTANATDFTGARCSLLQRLFLN